MNYFKHVNYTHNFIYISCIFNKNKNIHFIALFKKKKKTTKLLKSFNEFIHFLKIGLFYLWYDNLTCNYISKQRLSKHKNNDIIHL